MVQSLVVNHRSNCIRSVQGTKGLRPTAEDGCLRGGESWRWLSVSRPPSGLTMDEREREREVRHPCVQLMQDQRGRATASLLPSRVHSHEGLRCSQKATCTMNQGRSRRRTPQAARTRLVRPNSRSCRARNCRPLELQRSSKCPPTTQTPGSCGNMAWVPDS